MVVKITPQSELGTRVLLLESGATIAITKKDDSELIDMDVWHDKTMIFSTKLEPREALTLIESLAVAARPGTGGGRGDG